MGVCISRAAAPSRVGYDEELLNVCWLAEWAKTASASFLILADGSASTVTYFLLWS